MSAAAILSGLLPVFLLIALGYGLRKSKFLAETAWRPIEIFAVYVLYPGFLVPAIWHADLSGPSAGPVGAAILITIAISAGLGLALKPVLRLSGPTYSSVFQGLIRFNSFVFIPAAAAIFGPKAMSLAAVAVSALIPLTNLLSILALAHWGLRVVYTGLYLGNIPTARTIIWGAGQACTVYLFVKALGWG